MNIAGIRTRSLAGLLLLGALSGGTSIQAAVSCSGVPAWSATTTYAVGAQVTYGGKLYKALVSTANVPPDYCPACGWWQLIDVCGSAACTAAPSVPTGLAASGLSASSVNLSWSAVTPPANCSVTYNVFQGATQVATGLTSPSATVKGLTANTSYSFTVTAVDAVGASASSAALTVKTPAACTAAPSVPTGLTSSSQTSTSITLSWNSVTPPANCAVTYTVYSSGSAVASGLTSNGTILTGLSAGTTYSLTVAAVDGAGTSAQSAALSVKTPAACTSAPAVPTGLSSPAQTSSSIDLSWSPVSTPTGCSVTYQVYKNGALALTVPTTTATLSGLSANTSYTVSVAASNAVGASSQSGTISVKTSGTPTGNLTLGDVANPNGRYFAGYYPSWSDNWFSVTNWDGTKLTDDQIYTASNFAKVPGVYTHVKIAFGQPNFTWNGMGANNWSGTGINFNCTPADMKEVIRILHILKKKVILAVGGATYNSWSTLSAEAGTNGATKAALTQFMKDLDIDGLDVDYEVTGVDPTSLANYAKAIQSLREACDAAGSNKLLTMAAWSTGADYTAATGAGPLGISYWGGDAGRERQTFAMSCVGGPRAGQSIGSLFDVLDIMSYDAQTLHYDPVTAFDEYRALVPAKTVVSIGLEIAPEGWAGGLLVLYNGDQAGEGTYITQDQYGRTGRGAYSVERFGNYVKINTTNANPHDGLMLWQVLKTTSPTDANATSVANYVGSLFNYTPTHP